jgi:hypothetical protein
MGGTAFFVLVSLGVAAFAAASAAKKRATANDAWRDAAVRLRLLFKPGDLFTHPQIVGTLRSCQVSVNTFTKSSDKAKWTRYRVEFRAPHGYKLHIRQQGFLAGIRKAFGQTPIEFGDSEFDARFEVRAGNPDALHAFLNPLRRHRLLELFDTCPGIVIEQHRLTWEVKGLQTAPGRMADTLERLVAAAEDLSPDDPSAAEVSPRDGITEARRVEPARLPASTIRRTAPSPAPSRQAGTFRTAPADAAAKGGAEARRTVARTDLEPAPAAQPEVQTLGASVPAAPPQSITDGGESGPAVASVSTALFGRSTMSNEVAGIFAERFRTQPVRWSGELRTVSRYPFDRVFGSTPGTRATFVVHQMETPLGRRPVQAIVQLPADAIRQLRSEVGKLFVFEGRLVDCDSFMRSIYVGDGRIVWSRPEPAADRP